MLIIDDVEVEAQIIKRHLEAYGHVCRIAHSGNEALAVIRDEAQPDLIIESDTLCGQQILCAEHFKESLNAMSAQRILIANKSHLDEHRPCGAVPKEQVVMRPLLGRGLARCVLNAPSSPTA